MIPVLTIDNILWFLLAGWWLALGYVLAGVLAIVLIITFPFGIASFRLAGYVVWPFGRTVVVSREAGIWSLVGNVLWIILFGWELALIHLAAGLHGMRYLEVLEADWIEGDYPEGVSDQYETPRLHEYEEAPPFEAPASGPPVSEDEDEIPF